MSIGLTESQADVRDLVRRVAQEKFRPSAFERRFKHEPPRENLALLGELGILGMCIAEEYGGSGRTALDAMIAIEEISRGCPMTGEYSVLTITGPASFVEHWGTEEQKKRLIPPIAAGKELISISITEPQAGTALTDLQTRGEIDGDVCRVNGQKIFSTGASHVDHILVFVRFGPGTDGIGAVIVHKDTPGLTIGKEYHHFSGHTWNELHFEDATIPAQDVLAIGGAARKLISSYNLERCGACAFAIGVAQLALDLSIGYVEDRRQFGRPISDFQMVQARLADMYIQLTSARLLLHHAVTRTQDTLPPRLEASAAKVAAMEAACSVTDSAMQLHGGSGMSTDLPLEWLYRMVRPYTVAGGTSDIHRSMVASELVGRRFDNRG